MDQTTTIKSEDEQAIVARIAELEWRQGCVLPPSLFASLQPCEGWSPDPESDVVLVLTGDCNVLHHKLDQEPVVDVVCGRWVDAVDGNCTNRKHPRMLDVTLREGQSQRHIRFEAWRRGTIARSELAKAAPSGSLVLPPEVRRLVVEWWAGGRYQRASFPNAFNQRLSADGRRNKLERLMKKVAGEVLAVYVVVLPDRELESADEYAMVLRAVVVKEAYDDGAARGRLEEAFYEPFMDLLKAPGIRMADHLLLSEEDFSVRDLRRMTRLDLDHLSYSGSEGTETGPIPPRP